MAAVNVVRVRVRPEFENVFIDAYRNARPASLEGFRRGSVIKTGDRSFCMIGEWDDLSALENAREQLIDVLDQVRHMLEDLGSDLGVTDPVSGEVVLELTL